MQSFTPTPLSSSGYSNCGLNIQGPWFVWSILITYRRYAWRQPRLRLLLLQFTMSRGQCVLFQYTATDIAVLTESAGTLQCNVLWLILGFYSLYLRTLLKIVSFGSHLRVTLNKRIVHCPSNFCWWNWRSYVLIAFLPIVLSAMIISVYFILYVAPQITTTRVQI
jgi:hypothetical protein